jgi:antitoxin VapB
MSDKTTAKLLKHGRSQAVRLPKEFRLPGKEVRVRRSVAAYCWTL